MGILTSALALASLFLCTSEVRAGENEGRISLSAGADFSNAYYFRGILQTNKSFVAQPYADVTFNLYEGENGLNSVGATLGFWNSFQSRNTVDVSDPTAWYEVDLYGGFTFGLFDNWETGVTYTAYISPNNAFSTVQEISFSFSFDDSELLGAFALAPSALLAVEVKGQADGGSNKGVYLQLGVEPGFTLIESENYPVSLSFPLTLGLSLSDYYQNSTGDDDTFGYFDLGVNLSVPLSFIPADYGSWEVFVKGDFLFLGDNLEAVNDGDSFEAIGTIGISLAY
jgi:hypothetical protein